LLSDSLTDNSDILPWNVDLRDVLLHEIAHALLEPGIGHGRVENLARSLGCNPTECVSIAGVLPSRGECFSMKVSLSLVRGAVDAYLGRWPFEVVAIPVPGGLRPHLVGIPCQPHWMVKDRTIGSAAAVTRGRSSMTPPHSCGWRSATPRPFGTTLQNPSVRRVPHDARPRRPDGHPWPRPADLRGPPALAILHAGDVYDAAVRHMKGVYCKPEDLTRWVQDRGTPVHAVWGNHDGGDPAGFFSRGVRM